MITKEQAKKLLAKKSLSGHEAGKLWMEDSFLIVRGQEGLLTEKEHRYMRSLVRTQEDIEIYNSYLSLYSRAEIALKEADIMALSAKSSLLDSALLIKEHIDREVSSWNRPHDLPVKITADNTAILDISLSISLDHIKQYLRIFMAYKARIDEFSRETGVDFSNDIRNGLRGINYALEIYNFYANAPEVKGDKIILDKIKADRQTLKALYEGIYPIRDQEASDGKEA